MSKYRRIKYEDRCQHGLPQEAPKTSAKRKSVGVISPARELALST